MKLIPILFLVLAVFIIPSTTVYENPNADICIRDGVLCADLPCYVDSTQNYWTQLCTKEQWEEQNKITIQEINN